MRIMVTGANGFTGSAIATSLISMGHTLRLMDIRPWESEQDTYVGDVTHYNDCCEAADQMDAMVICHMAPRANGIYENDPSLAFDINVKGTANLFQAAVKKGIKKICLISSTSTVMGHGDDVLKTCDMHPKANGLYPMTKALQEVIAEQYQRDHDLQVSVLRCASIIDGTTNLNKNGDEDAFLKAYLIDRHDIGLAAGLALASDEVSYEIFYPHAVKGADKLMETKSCFDKLNWKPQYTFED